MPWLRRWITLPLLVALSVMLAAPAPAADTIRVGYLGPQTGIFAAAGKDMLERDQLPTLFLTTPDDLTKRVAAIAMDNGFGHEGIDRSYPPVKP